MAGPKTWTQKDIESIMYALSLVANETGYGKVEIEIRDAEIVEVRAEHRFKPTARIKPVTGL